MRALIILSAIFLCFTNNLSAQDMDKEKDAIIIKSIFDESLSNGTCYERLRSLCKDVGPRLSGSPGADKAVDWAVEQMEAMGFDKVYKQACMVPVWERGDKESCVIKSKYAKKEEPLNVCALGYSHATPKGGITAEVVKVNGIEEVKAMKAGALKGKIVFYNRPMDERMIETFDAYGGCVDQRSRGAIEAELKGAVGSIVRSMGLRNDDYPHTGTMAYGTEPMATIPAVAVSTKGADDLEAWLERDPELEIELKVNSRNLPDKESFNVIGEITGSEYPDRFIVVSGHLDSWDLAEGAHDDGAGVVHSLEVVQLFKQLEIRPKHTIRVVLFMNEENGTRGARKYAEEVKEKGEYHLVAIESDSGGFVPRGFCVEGTGILPMRMLTQISKWEELLEPYNLHRFKEDYSGVDIHLLKDQNFPLVGFYPDPQRYFDIHHTELDVFESVNKRELELGAASIASFVYLSDKYGILAPVKKMIPNNRKASDL